MSEPEQVENADDKMETPPELAPIEILPDDKKAEIRTKVWNYLDKNQLTSVFSPYRKISNFKGADAAGDLVATLDVFKTANCIKVDPDKPLQQVRYVTLKAGKTLVVPTPRNRTGLLTKIVLPPDSDDATTVKYATRQGVEEVGEPIGLDDSIQVDLVILGCVAVSTNGWRIGKGLGFSDLEYAMLASVKAIDPSIPVVTIVHDCQVLDLPDSLFDTHDVAVDIIVTPTRVIQCTNVKPRPSGIIWNLLNADRLDRVRILKRLRYREWKVNKDVRLSGEEENPEELTDELPPADDEMTGGRGRRRINNRRKPRKPYRYTDDEAAAGDVEDDRKVNDARNVERRRGTGFRGRGRRRPRPRREDENHRLSENERDGESERDDERDETREGGSRRFIGRRRRFRRRFEGEERREDGGQLEDDDRADENVSGRRRRGRRSESDGGGAVNEAPPPGRRRYFRPMGRRPYYGDCEGSVYVGALPRSLRVSEFKAEVRDRNVQPLRVIWRGSSGYAFLGFRTMEDAEKALEALDGLHISDQNLRLEMAKSSGRRRRRGPPRSADSGGGDDHVTSDDE